MSNTSKKSEQLKQEIIKLVSELAEIASEGKDDLIPNSSKRPKDKSGATGGVRLLVEEGFFGTPQQLQNVLGRLKEEGRHYSKPTVAMALLNLVRERVLTRFKDSGDKKWKYAIRK